MERTEQPWLRSPLNPLAEVPPTMATMKHEPQRNNRPKLVLAPHQIILRPLVTEKGMHKATRYNAYAFEVNRMAGKDDIRRAIEELFDVKVVRVQHAEPQGQAAADAVPPGNDQELEEGHRHAGPRTSDRLLLKIRHRIERIRTAS